MRIKWVAIDDEPLALELIRAYASKIPSLELLQTFTDAVFAAEYLKTARPDLLFLDINMPDITGIELLKTLPSKPPIIFTTAHRKYAVEAFELDAVDYLVKPFEFVRFEKAVNKAIDSLETNVLAPDHIFIKADYQQVNVLLSEIEYIESIDDYLKIHLTSGKYVMTLMTIKAILEKLPATYFRRIHRSYIVALPKIKVVASKKVQLTSIELPVSDSYSGFMNG
jgi:two-component system, LytTR family, response regulator